jgi:hypothetical protein
MKKSSSFSVDLYHGRRPPHVTCGPGVGDGGGEDRPEDDLYFEMEFPVHGHPSSSASRLSVESCGSQSTLDSRDSPSRDGQEYNNNNNNNCYGAALPPVGAAAPPRERPNSLIIPIKTMRGGGGGGKGDFFGSLPRRRKGNRVPKISLPNYSVPVTPADSWEKGNFLGNLNLSGSGREQLMTFSDR